MDSVSYARRFDNVTGSAIREIFKVLGRPGMISFAGGNPSLDALPDQLCADLARDALLADGKRILQYGATEGYPPFLESLAAYLKEHFGFSMEEDGVLPTTGSTSGMDLLLKALVSMYRQSPKGAAAYAIMAGAFVLTAFAGVDAVLVILMCGAIGLASSLQAKRRAA